MKVLSVAEAQVRLDAVCKEALAEEGIRLQDTNGSLLELTPVPVAPPVTPLSERELAECYGDADWAAFENNCAQVATRITTHSWLSVGSGAVGGLTEPSPCDPLPK